MPELKPSVVKFDRNTGGPQLYERKLVYRLSDLRGLFYDRDSVERMLAAGTDPIIYEVYEIPSADGMLSMACTVIRPGKVGREYHFTRGHFHEREPRSEVYVGVEGGGLLILQARDGQVMKELLRARGVVHIPPRCAHRAINTGRRRMVFLSIYPSDAGHDYGSIEREGFAKLVVERGGRPALIDNPRHKRHEAGAQFSREI